MTDPQDIPGQVTDSIGLLWTAYAGSAPSDVRTSIRDNVVTCVLVGAVEQFERNMVAKQPRHTVKGVGRPTARGFKLEAVAAVVRLTGKRVAAYVSSHDPDTDVATEVFTLKPAPAKRNARGDKQFAHAFWLSPLPPCRDESEVAS